MSIHASRPKPPSLHVCYSMREKRKRNTITASKGLAVGERLNRNRLLAECDLRWNWIGTERVLRQPTAEQEDLSDVIVISDGEDELLCDKKRCKDNPFCLNYLGQDKWEDEVFIKHPVKSEEAYLKVHLRNQDPSANSRKSAMPVGLKVWFQDLAFRSGVYRCQPLLNSRLQFKDSPIFQLQVTFAALQEGNQSVFNPIKLVESLRLRTSEQQDAQEFSKLFMSHLDDEFRKQSNPELHQLTRQLQFEGKMVNATVCDKCKTRSERDTTFLELEVNLEKTGVLEDRIAAVLTPERLEDDNKYLCSVCESLQDATRYTEIRSLPPGVAYISSALRVRSLDVRAEKIKAPSQVSAMVYENESDDDIYELKGVLLHKGQSAYHGHYEAQVFNQATKKWYQFNDEVVTSLASFHTGNSEDINAIKVDDDEENRPIKRQKRSAKLRRVEDSDDEQVKQVTPASIPSRTKRLVSKDAYMLIYTRRKDPKPIDVKTFTPPQDALEIVRSLNEAHDKKCSDYKTKQDAEKKKFVKIREMVLDVYRSWAVSSTSDLSVVVSKTALENWLLRWFNLSESESITKQENHESYAEETNGNDPDHSAMGKLAGPEANVPRVSSAELPNYIDNSSLLCRHDRLNPLIGKEMKLMSKVARDKMIRNGFTFKPEITIGDICNQCVEDEFLEKLYQIEHPQLVSIFNMAYELLKQLFPSWNPPALDTNTCEVCATMVHISKESKLEQRKKAEDEKAQLPRLNDNHVFGQQALIEHALCAIVPSPFIHEWRAWLIKPGEVQRPAAIDNSYLICEHGKLIVDLSDGTDFDDELAIVSRTEWDLLQNLYNAAPLIAVSCVSEHTEDGGERKKITNDLSCCFECRTRNKLNFVSTSLIIILLKPTEVIPQASAASSCQPVHSDIPSYSFSNESIRTPSDETLTTSYGKTNVLKKWTIKDVKISISKVFKIPTISQRLYYRGKELEDNTETVANLQIFERDTLYLKEIVEDMIILDSDLEDSGTGSKKRTEGDAFKGTLLSGISSPLPSGESEKIADSSRSSSPSTEKPCPTCTYLNDFDASMCKVCDNPV
ncbi:hypothetical protein EW145_g1149 [Phellinidium pouzarii]|uniref:ubiquitinyl hydrolase 1 n=1 Tax=Phellinidium pouzarii TaxID=167371 RepID=A0A4S4LFJ0_9AGAM|nr:hypothetical protein EW145_g1149 [Phellinidium pouzarii]